MAALIAEMDDGTRMVYEIGGPVTLETEAETMRSWAEHIVITDTYITVSGRLLGGRIWTGDMPACPPEVDAGRRLSAGSGERANGR